MTAIGSPARAPGLVTTSPTESELATFGDATGGELGVAQPATAENTRLTIAMWTASFMRPTLPRRYARVNVRFPPIADVGDSASSTYAAVVDRNGLEARLVEQWQHAARDLGIRVTAPIELQDASGQPFTCEALVHDFGSATGGVVVSAKTERRFRAQLRSVRDKLWVSRSGPLIGYNRKYFIDELVDWGWFGERGGEPRWYSERVPHSG